MKNEKIELVGNYIPDELKKIFNETIGMVDYKYASKESGYSLSTVCNIVNQRTKVTKNTLPVVYKLLVCSEFNIHQKRHAFADWLYEIKTYWK